MQAALLLCLALLAPALACAQEVRIAAAADLAPSMKQLTAAFEHAHPGAHLVNAIGSSVNLRTQIENGAPFDVFLSADTEQPQQLIEQRRADRDSFFTYAIGELALLVPEKNAGINDLQKLGSSEVRKIAIANPAHAPYGRAAVAALKSAGLYDRLQSKIVEGENVAQAAQFVISGNADAGIVSMSAFSAAGSGFRAYLVDPTLYPQIAQGAVLTNAGARNENAKAFMDFLRSSAAQAILHEHGLRSPSPVLKPIGR